MRFPLSVGLAFLVVRLYKLFLIIFKYQNICGLNVSMDDAYVFINHAVKSRTNLRLPTVQMQIRDCSSNLNAHLKSAS